MGFFRVWRRSAVALSRDHQALSIAIDDRENVARAVDAQSPGECLGLAQRYKTIQIND
jgi:hypothetical protein